MQKRILIILILLCISISAPAVSIKTVEGTYTFYAPSTMSIQEAEQEAIRRAQINALANAFGRVIVENTTSIQTTDDELFYQEGNSLVKGEWLETIGEPTIERGFYGDDFYVKCTIKGKAREIKSAKTELDVKVLCNNTEVDYEQVDFKNGNRLYLQLKSAERGFLSIYLYDKKADVVSCLFPYPHDNRSTYPIDRDKVYILFSKKQNKFPTRVVEYVMNCSDDVEVNTLYIIFSKKDFSKPTLTYHDGIRSIGTLSFARFNRWLIKCQSEEESLQVVSKNINISKE